MRRRIVRTSIAVTTLVVAGILAVRAPAGAAPASSPAPATLPGGGRLANPSVVLKKGWQQSADVAWTVTGDGDGLHVLTAKEAEGYVWNTVATLNEPSFETDRWIGQGCLTQSGKHLVVVYAPRSFTNNAALSTRGAFTAVVDLPSGAVHKLPVSASLAYYNPGCGVGESAVLTQEGDDAHPGTRLLSVDAAKASVGKPIPVALGVSSAVPTVSGIVAATGNQLVNVASTGALKGIVATSGTAFDLAVTGDGVVVHADHVGDQIRVRQTLNGRTVTLGTGNLSGVSVRRGGAGKVFVTGAVKASAKPSKTVQLLPDVTPQETVSTDGDMALQVQATSATDPTGTSPVAAPVDSSARVPVTIAARLRSTAKTASFTVHTDTVASAAALVASGTATPGSVSPMVVGQPNSPVDDDRTCAIGRNDVTTQVYQPTPRQAEWAVDQAVRSALTVSRPAGWRNDNLGAFTPQGLFPMPALAGGGNVPAQIMLGILAQESNMWQASKHAESGEYGNPIVGNFYGNNVYDSDPNNDWLINWANADCGYGIAQVTTGMRLSDTSLSGTQKRAVALDYATNIAAGLQILIGKWNQIAAKNMKVNDGKPQWIENWYLALWGYNTGVKNLGDAGTDGTVQGLGWINNPANPHYPANRAAFLDVTYADAAHPQDWPYQEKVIGFAGHPIDTLDGPGYRAAWWTTTANRAAAQPSPTIACTTANLCYPGQKFTPNDPTGCPSAPSCVIGEPAGPCAHKSPAGYYNLQCYWNSSISWKGDCNTSGNCGNELERFDPGLYPEQPDGTHYPPSCGSPLGNNPLPSNAVIVDDVPASVPGYRCGTRPPTTGSFALAFRSTNGLYESKIDFHQLGGGYGGHFWFAHTQQASSPLKVVGSWNPPTALIGWNRVMVHIPDHGAWTQQAHYHINTGTGPGEDRYIPTDIQANTWVSLGVFNFVSTGVTNLTLDNVSPDGTGDADVAWDAAAFLPLPGKPRDIVVTMGDSYTSGEGAEPYFAETDRGTPDNGQPVATGSATWNACRRSTKSWIRKAFLPGQTQNLATLSSTLDPTVDLHTIACSGAFTYNVDPAGAGFYPNPWGVIGQHHEVPQIQAGFLDTNTTLVTLTLSGNDADFVGTVQDCIGPLSNCPSDATVQANINKATSRLKGVLPDIRAKAPNAKIVVLGYPLLFNSNTITCTSTLAGSTVRAKLNQFGTWFDTAEQSAVASVAGGTIKYYSVNAEFNGYRICDDNQGINDAVHAPTGPGDFSCPGNPICISMESYHPNSLGTTRYAIAFQNALH